MTKKGWLCRKATRPTVHCTLPILAEVAETYKDRGVVLYAVNEGEEPLEIRSFLERNRLSLKVPLDSRERVGELYGVDGIPQTVIIGTDGTVQAVHIGFRPDLKEKLTEELDACPSLRLPG